MFRKLFLVSMLALAVSSCDDQNPVVPTPSTQTVVFQAVALSSNEVPAVTNADAGASGNMTITFTLTKDTAGTVTAGKVDFVGTFAGFPAGTSLTAAHIHTGAAGTNGGILVNTAITSGEISFPAGTGSLNKTGISLTVDQANSIVANPAGFYFNAHTALNPGGAVRGQLVRIQ